MKTLKVLGPGCPKCERLYADTERAAIELGVEYTLEKVTDIMAIGGYGVMMTPALVVDDEVKCVGKVPPADELKALILGE